MAEGGWRRGQRAGQLGVRLVELSCPAHAHTHESLTHRTLLNVALFYKAVEGLVVFHDDRAFNGKKCLGA